jgi:hypothetical protein
MAQTSENPVYEVYIYSRSTDATMMHDIWDMFTNLDDAMYEADFYCSADEYAEIYIAGTDDRVYTSQYM